MKNNLWKRAGFLDSLTVWATHSAALHQKFCLRYELVDFDGLIFRRNQTALGVGIVIRIEMSYCPTCIRRSVLPSLYKMMHGTLV